MASPEELYRSEVRSHIPEQCGCLPSVVLASVIAETSFYERQSVDTAIAELHESIGSDCLGPQAVENNRDGCMPQLVCGHPNGPKFLLERAAEMRKTL